MTDIPIPDPADGPESHDDGLLRRVQPLLTLLIAFAAIGLAVWEGAENRRHNRLSVQPRLGAQVDAGRAADTEYVRMSVESTGLGPAVVKAFRIYLDGEPQDTAVSPSTSPWSKVIQAVSTPRMQLSTHAFGSSYYFPAGREQVLFEARSVADSSRQRPVSRILERVAVQICYCSIYGTDCDQVLVTTTKLKPASCPK